MQMGRTSILVPLCSQYGAVVVGFGVVVGGLGVVLGVGLVVVTVEGFVVVLAKKMFSYICINILNIVFHSYFLCI